MTAYLCVLGAAILRPEKRQSLRVTTQLKCEFCEHGRVSSRGKSLVLTQVFEYGTQYLLFTHIMKLNRSWIINSLQRIQDINQRGNGPNTLF
jgi:hypothetical protein